ncbi:hypothetical protein NicSoilC5_04010 [Arthrobacter sp. NicSoilC5]|nr:hypothetical protein NicSoilC5_04010 [Arthrobacter sp. NicSoilC5]
MPAPLQEPVPNWTKLRRGDRVAVSKNGTLLASGIVDMVALDGSVFWLNQDGVAGRSLLLYADKLTVLKRP